MSQLGINKLFGKAVKKMVGKLLESQMFFRYG